MREQLGSGAGDVAQILPELRDLLPDLASPPTLDPEGARFRLFDATTSFVRRAAEACAIVLVLDDLHAADTPSLLLLEFLAQQLADMKAIVLGIHRAGDLGPEQRLPDALADLIRRTGSSLRLTGLGEEDVAALVAAGYGVEPPGGLAAAIHRKTEGNPLFVGEILRLLAAEGRLEEPVDASTWRVSIPATVRDVIGRRLQRLSDECKNVLTLAAVLGAEFELEALRRVADRELEPLLDLLDEAISAGVVGEVAGAHGRFRFAHALVRDALYDDLTATGRMRLHRRAGEVLEELYAGDPDSHLAELAHHFHEAAPAGAAAKAVGYARLAGDRAAELLAYEEAARLYAIGIATIEAQPARDDLERCELLLSFGDVQARAGEIPVAKETYLRAAELARRSECPEQLARAALGHGGRFVWTRAWGDAQLVPLLEEALRLLPHEDSELRVRLLARLAGGPLRDTLPPDTRVELAEEAVEMARRRGDPATLAHALAGRHCANWGPDVLSERLAIADELIQVAEGAGDLERAHEGRDFRFWALLEAGDMQAAHAEYAALTTSAERLRQPAQFWDVSVGRALLALFAGRFAEAEAAIEEALTFGRSAERANARMASALQTYALRREQGRLEELLDVVERAVDDYPAYPIWSYVLADVYAELGRRDDARAAFDSLAADGFSVYLEMQRLFCMALMPGVCAYLGDVERAGTLYGLLLPYAARNALTPQELCFGSVARGLGLLAATRGEWEAAAAHFEAALELNDRMGARPWLAHTQHDYGRMLLRRDAPGDRDRAQELLASAKALAGELGMDALTARL